MLALMFEQIYMVFLSGYGDLKCRDAKKIPNTWKYAGEFLVPVMANLIVAYFNFSIYVHGETPLKLIRFLGAMSIWVSRNAVMEAGLWSTMVAQALFDFLVGIPVILRYFIFYLMGIPLREYTPGEFQILPLAVYVLLSLVTFFPILHFLQRFRNALANPGPVLKLLAVFFWAPTFLAIRPIGLFDLSENMIIIISSITSLSVLALGWIYLAGYWNRVYSENHYLEMQTELVREHNQLLKEQKEVLRMCKVYGGQEQPEESAYDLATEAKYSSSDILNTAIENKVRKCREQNLDLELNLEKIVIPESMKEIEFLSIFYNLTDNAMEAAMQCEPGRRKIRLESHSDEDRLYFTVKNSRKAGKNTSRIGRLMTTKPDRKNHGYGLKIVGDLVRKNHGQLQLKDEDETFEARVFLNIKNNEAGES